MFFIVSCRVQYIANMRTVRSHNFYQYDAVECG